MLVVAPSALDTCDSAYNPSILDSLGDEPSHFIVGVVVKLVVFEANKRVPHSRFVKELILLLELLLVSCNRVQLSVHPEELDLLPFKFFACGVEARIAVTMVRCVVGLVEVLAHLLIKVVVWIVEVIHHGIEVCFSSCVLE